MKKKEFPLRKVLKYREYLEKDQASKFRDALTREKMIEDVLTRHKNELNQKLTERDNLVSPGKVDIKKVKRLQEEILYAQVDESVLNQELHKASNARENERLRWLDKKSETDAIEKLKGKFVEVVNKEYLAEEQKDIDEIARQAYLREEGK